ncbi:hypothetical protein CJO79_21590 (plasmid) [Ralstonia solanacearum]|uniref:hypothetical protein n=1 Tax=Ralstonia solanacearum species complex TaxID=3116862 RepID=UPI000E58D3A6|nr:hypothetical protein [Ralstonia solanacearum]AXV93541.1 hypothetical protein CJO79_21590 [Ralstonia solanacearum]BEU74682.1 hypothetical protein MAFF211271_42370 [Ralstonia pseudosolanacearum]
MAIDLKQYFQNETDFSLKFERLPFAKHDTLALRWANWLARVSYEEGEQVKDDSAQIQEWLGERAPPALSAIDRRIRLVFGDDEDMTYTNQILYLMDFLRDIEGCVVVDPGKKDLVA